MCFAQTVALDAAGTLECWREEASSQALRCGDLSYVTRRYPGVFGVLLCISYYKVEIRGLGSLRYIGFNKTSTPKGESMKFARVVAMLLGGLAIGASSAAFAGVSVGVNIGIPAPVYVAPQPVYAPPPPPVVYQPAPVYAAPAIVIGWHGDRYWDGRRYWARDDWYRHHGGGYGPGRGHGYDHGGPPGHWH
ncbi:PXPV repeat-containing protein [Paraburkholderia eburnea]|uniref:PXPV repeat-containing protein n=2 Tax=Paraburkholderia eburnea TaxID=1189126 RepID=A0A2S4MGE1_9BURK|nr:PXPV repeat-containing protein [Paraburkholderia eburnea]PRZ25699.1 PXPV repeat-containing protein [Paraburkholderia eburnea]